MAFPASQLLCAATGRLNCQMAAIDGQTDRNRLATAMSQCVLITSETPSPSSHRAHPDHCTVCMFWYFVK